MLHSFEGVQSKMPTPRSSVRCSQRVESKQVGLQVASKVKDMLRGQPSIFHGYAAGSVRDGRGPQLATNFCQELQSPQPGAPLNADIVGDEIMHRILKEM